MRMQTDHWARSLVALLAGFLSLNAQDPPFRSRDLPAIRSGRTGFTLLAPDATQVRFTNQLSDAKAAENQVRLNGSGVAAGDFDGDGWCDLYFCNLEGSNRLYRNRGNWRFEDVTATAGVALSNQFCTGAVFADVDGDGKLDLLLNSIGGGTRLFKNAGSGKFAEDASSGLARKYAAMSLALADIDGDGWLDLYVPNYRTTTMRSTGLMVMNINGKPSVRPEDRADYEYTPEGMLLEHGEPHLLYRNDGHGRFAAVSWTGGAFRDESGKALAAAPRDWGLAAMFRDLNGDGAPDLYVCNDFQSPDRLWINDGQGRFRAIDALALRNTSRFSMAVDFADINRDGFDDFIVTDMLQAEHAARMRQIPPEASHFPIGDFTRRLQYTRNTLQLNRGDATFAEVAFYAGIEASGWTWAAAFLDVDLDGYEDLLMTTGQMFDTQDLDALARVEANGPYRTETIPSKLLMRPNAPSPKAAYQNRGSRAFPDAAKAWGFDTVGVSHGMCLADLDNDGDLDVVVNNLNGVAGLYRNESTAPRLAVRLHGESGNSQGIGARISVTGGAVPQQSQEIISGGRYLSGDDPMRVFAAGTPGNRMRIEVQWRRGKKSIIEGASANKLYEVFESAAQPAARLPSAMRPQPLFRDASAALGHSHHEAPFDDFARQPLLPKRLSQGGPGVAWFDLDGDGRDDLIAGSGKGGRPGVYQNDGRGGFKALENNALKTVVTRDQTTMLGWIKAGRAGLLAGSANYEDGLPAGSSVRQYDFKDGRNQDDIPGQRSSTGPLALGDADGDGTLDLFVGGQVVPGRYPEAADSMIFLNRENRWVEDKTNLPALRKLGLVNGAVWTDLDGDGRPELVLACEWDSLRVFESRSGQLRDRTKEWGLDQYLGFWQGVTAADFNGDGKMDLAASNWGLNTRFRASREHPTRLYFGDLDGSGTVSVITSHFEAGRWVPDRDLLGLSRGLPSLLQMFPTHAAYGAAPIEELFSERTAKIEILGATSLASMVFLNEGTRFAAKELPPEAQFAPAFGLCAADFDGDGFEDLFVSQNFDANEPQSGRNDAGRGLLLLGNGRGAFRAVPAMESGIKIYGSQRGAATADFDGDGRPDLVVGQNGATTALLHNQTGKPGLRVRLAGPPGNPTGVGSVLRLNFGTKPGPAREVHAGSGYWSQDSPIQVLALPREPKSLEIRWPGGKVTQTLLPPQASQIVVDETGRAL